LLLLGLLQVLIGNSTERVCGPERCLCAFVGRVLAITDKAEQPLGLFASLRRSPRRSMRADSEEALPTEYAVLNHISGVAALATDAKAPDRLTVVGIPNGFARLEGSPNRYARHSHFAFFLATS
jgi:hypothetical protein